MGLLEKEEEVETEGEMDEEKGGKRRGGGGGEWGGGSLGRGKLGVRQDRKVRGLGVLIKK